MINNQLGGNLLALPNRNNIFDNLDTEDDVHSIFMNLEENNIKLMANFVNENNFYNIFVYLFKSNFCPSKQQ